MASDLTQLGFLVFVYALVAMLSKRLYLPYTAGLVLAGMGLSYFDIYIKWHLSKDLIFSVFFTSPGVQGGTVFQLATVQEGFFCHCIAGNGRSNPRSHGHGCRYALRPRLGLG